MENSERNYSIDQDNYLYNTIFLKILISEHFMTHNAITLNSNPPTNNFSSSRMNFYTSYTARGLIVQEKGAYQKQVVCTEFGRSMKRETRKTRRDRTKFRTDFPQKSAEEKGAKCLTRMPNTIGSNDSDPESIAPKVHEEL